MQCWKAVSKYKSKWVFETHIWNELSEMQFCFAIWNAILKCMIWSAILKRKIATQVEMQNCNAAGAHKHIRHTHTRTHTRTHLHTHTHTRTHHPCHRHGGWEAMTRQKCNFEMQVEVQDWNACCNANLQFNLNARLKCRFEMQVECTFEKQF